MLDFTFLEKEQVIGDKKLSIFKDFYKKAFITDFAVLLGGNHSDGITNDLRKGHYWTKTQEDDEVVSINFRGMNVSRIIKGRSAGCRPVISYSAIKDLCSNKERKVNGILHVEFGEYPQQAPPQEVQEELNKKYNKGMLSLTGKDYTLDSIDIKELTESFLPKLLAEYEYNGKKYVRIQAKFCYDYPEYVLLNEQNYKYGDYVWVEVEPIKWIIDEKTDLAVSKNILFSGIQFHNKDKYDIPFEETDIKKYLDEYFSKDIIPSVKINIDQDKKIDLKNAYEFDFKQVSEEDLIKASLESNLAPFLHGKSSEGKSARIKQFDPDAEIVYLRNATPDSLNGKSVYDSKNNQMIDVPPTWYVKLKEKCEKDPDKLHIVFFDELTNALPSIQGMAFNIILDKEINGKWKLPENARVAAAGNDLEDSLAANTMAEPLFNRFNHVYINTTVDDWLKWALTPTDSYERLDYKKEENNCLKIHPAIYAYIACKKEAVLRTKFTGVKPNADPRKWEMASKVLYTTNNPYMLRGLIGEELTNDFVAFCQTKVITIDDVINGNYNEEIFKINSSEKYLTTLALSNVDEKNVEVIRSFIEKLGKDFLALFDSLWTMGNDERLETLMNLKQGKAKVKK